MLSSFANGNFLEMTNVRMKTDRIKILMVKKKKKKKKKKGRNFNDYRNCDMNVMISNDLFDILILNDCINLNNSDDE